MQVLLVSCGAGRLPRIASALQKRGALAGLWMADKNRAGIAPEKFRRAWPFHLAMKPFYHLTSPGVSERIYHSLTPIWRAWVRRQSLPAFDVVHSLMGSAIEPFVLADQVGALKVLDAASSHPTSALGFWQRECDIWCPGAKPGVPRWRFARVNRELEQADVIVCPSLFVRESMLYNGIPESKCVLNPFGVDPGVFTPRIAPPEKPRFVCVGAISLRKGYQYLFRAFAKVKQALPDAELVCAGQYFPDFRLERPRWHGTFTHHEHLPHTELAKILRTATAFVLPSIEEGFAKAVIEAMSSGLPIIATHESGATTLVKDGVEGLIIRARDVDQTAAAMIRLATDRALNERLGRAALACSTQKNTWDDYAGRLMTVYADALARKRGGGDTSPAR